MPVKNQNVGKTWQFYAGWVASALPALALLASAGMKLSGGAAITHDFVEKFGYQADSLMWIGIAELAVTLVYLFPRTSYLGAILLTGYLGGATATHVRIGENFIPPVFLGVLVWLGLYLRDHRARALMPLRQAPSREA